MGRKWHLCLLIVCVVLSQVIPVLLDQNIESSSALLIREKRAIDKTQKGEMPNSLGRFPYIVNILRYGVSHCGGIILESDIILTVEACIFPLINKEFSILSGSSKRNNGTRHNIRRDTVLVSAKGSVMFKIEPPINIRQPHRNRKIELFTGVLPPFANAWFGGWGCTRIEPGIPPTFPKELVITHLPIISHQECVEKHGHNINDPRYICTLDRSKRRATCLGDEGGPLVFQKHLIGVLLHQTLKIGIRPDVFINLLDHNEHQWIISSRDSLIAY